MNNVHHKASSTAWNSATLTDSENSSIGYGQDVDFPLSLLKDRNSKKLLTWNEESKPQHKANDADDEQNV
ncbi:hypothetical protein LIER_02758 [Lithospermum erythrorhizon]|uniref:Uncharacterized protein n=1 Tax=Lithospermum erythrorhizon TaxID=34254 RepID=A0AAV3NVB0_LITER